MTKKLSDLKPDTKNANKHSEYGMAMLEKYDGWFLKKIKHEFFGESELIVFALKLGEIINS